MIAKSLGYGADGNSVGADRCVGPEQNLMPMGMTALAASASHDFVNAMRGHASIHNGKQHELLGSCRQDYGR